MRRPPFSSDGPLRKVQADSGRPLGWLPSIKDQIQRLSSDITGLELRLRRQLSDGEPGVIIARKVFKPEAQVFAFDYLQNNSSSNNMQYVVRDAVTHEIPIIFPPPGAFSARFLVVKIWQRVYDNVQLIAQNMPVLVGNQMLRIYDTTNYTAANQWGAFQTPKFSVPTQLANAAGSVYTAGMAFSRRINFFWNMIDPKSGNKLADYLVPDQVLMPQGMGATPVSATQAGAATHGDNTWPALSNGRFRFRREWLFERDGQATFLFRPITPIMQPAAGSALASAFTETGQVDMSVTVQIELHGTRYVTGRDAMNKGAEVR